MNLYHIKVFKEIKKQEWLTSLSFQDSKFKTEEKSGTLLIKINDQETEIFLLATKESLWGKVWKMAGFPVFSLFQYNFHFLLPTFISQLFQYIGNLTMKDFSPLSALYRLLLFCIPWLWFSSLHLMNFLSCQVFMHFPCSSEQK